MAMTGSLNYYRGAGPAEATEPPPHFQGGPGAASQVLVQSAYHTGRGVTQGRTLSPYSGPASMGVTRPEDARVAIRANPGDLVKMAIPPPPPHTRTHARTRTRARTHAFRVSASQVAQSGFENPFRKKIKYFITEIGAKYTQSLSRINTHVLVPDMQHTSVKIAGAKKWCAFLTPGGRPGTPSDAFRPHQPPTAHLLRQDTHPTQSRPRAYEQQFDGITAAVIGKRGKLGENGANGGEMGGNRGNWKKRAHF